LHLSVGDLGHPDNRVDLITFTIEFSKNLKKYFTESDFDPETKKDLCPRSKNLVAYI